mmetsp:Transcript_16159/g.34956  ORF Transcript_16159/g.34956 Transcript_16159/m.34956 type:complete len:134 (-) Transcript_16159:817-1218(-)
MTLREFTTSGPLADDAVSGRRYPRAAEAGREGIGKGEGVERAELAVRTVEPPTTVEGVKGRSKSGDLDGDGHAVRDSGMAAMVGILKFVGVATCLVRIYCNRSFAVGSWATGGCRGKELSLAPGRTAGSCEKV